jgi:uncharacterized protein (TIGR03066 family)
MKTMTLAVMGFVILCLGAAARADDKDTAKMLVGKWEATKVDEGTLPQGTLVEFTKDGKLKIEAKKDGNDVSMTGSYKVEKTKLTVKLKMGEEEKEHVVTIEKISDTEFVAKHEDGKSITFTKKK